jgi:hypothetical protein
VLLLIAAAVIGAMDGLSVPWNDKTPAIIGLGIATALAAVAVAVRQTRLDSPRVFRWVVAAAFVFFAIVQGRRQVTWFEPDHLYPIAHALAVLLPLLAVVVVFAVDAIAVWVWRGCLVVFAVAAAVELQANHKPWIDVWYMLTHASQCATDMCNPYTMSTPDSGGVTYGITYLPGSFLFLTPFHVLYGDVRYGLVAALLVAAWAMTRLIDGRPGLIAGCLVLTVPGTLLGLQMSWVEPLLLVFVVLALLGRKRNMRTLVVLALAAAFVTKQHMLLLVPLVILVFGWRKTALAGAVATVVALPWFLASPVAFYDDTVKYFFALGPRGDALSLWAMAPTHLRPFLPPLLVVLTYAAVWRWLPRTAAGFLVGSGLILAGFEFVNKVSFYNEWALPAMLLLTGVMAGVATGAAEAPEARGQHALSEPRRGVTSSGSSSSEVADRPMTGSWRSMRKRRDGVRASFSRSC